MIIKAISISMIRYRLWIEIIHYVGTICTAFS